MLEARDEPVADGIAGRGHDNGDGSGRLLGSSCRWRPPHDDDIRVVADELRHEGQEPLGLPFRPAILHDDILSLHVAQFAETGTEGVEGRPEKLPHHPDPGHLPRLLRLSGARPQK